MFGIGAPKCGTTRMHRDLVAHPDCHFRAQKELHYFDTLNDLGFDWILELLEKRVVNLDASVMHAEAVPRERVLVMCYEHLMTRKGVRRLCNFPGIRHVEADPGRAVNEGKRARLPEDLRAEARRQRRPQYEFAARYFPSLPEAWQKTMSEGFA